MVAACAAVAGIAGGVWLKPEGAVGAPPDGRTPVGGRYEGCGGRDGAYDAAYPDYSAEDARDWVSFGDHVAVFHVRRGSERAVGEGERRGEIVVDQVLYTREGARELPASFEAPLYEAPCEPWVTEGHTYLGVLVHDAMRREPAHWMTVGRGGVLPYDDERIGTGEIDGRVGTVPEEDRSPFGLSSRMHGEHALSLQGLLMRTEPYAEAVADPGLTPGERYGLVAERLAALQEEQEARLED